MDWAQKRKILYAIAFAGIIILLASYPAYLFFHKAPTCFDAKQNGVETGVDCGGGCALMCAADVKPLRVVWAKAFFLGGNYYDIGAYVENPNVKAGLKKARYTLRVYDASGQFLVEKNGVTEIAPGSGFLLFESNVVIAEVPYRVSVIFENEDLATWTNATIVQPQVVTKNKNLKNVDTKPRLNAVLVNTDPVNEVTNLMLSAIIYDSLRRPIAVSKTYVDRIAKTEEQDIFFTWTNPFSSTKENFITEIIITPRAIFAE
ncbi:MAG: hypothetical protein WAV98_01985 [Minisyncoccia bacterium]